MLRCVIILLELTFIASLDLAKGNAAEPVNNNALRNTRPGTVRVDNEIKMKFVWCPAGTFLMGSPKSEEEPFSMCRPKQVRVVVTHGFWIAQTEVTEAQWIGIMATEPWKREELDQENVPHGPMIPAHGVEQDRALEFCSQLTRRERSAGRISDSFEYTLPTEAEWEYACRAGTTTKYGFGDDLNKLNEYGWTAMNTRAASEMTPHGVAQKKPNPWGIYDMHGNVHEWCVDVFHPKLPGGTDPIVTIRNDEYNGGVFRGGSWNAITESGERNGHFSPECFDSEIGFRPVLVRSRMPK